ncbi:MAG TPA: hypothetical protein VLA45_01910 [Paracoccaceae bacterium]|nr:hypothetical protein [Paracoccaceae bacterium]
MRHTTATARLLNPLALILVPMLALAACSAEEPEQQPSQAMPDTMGTDASGAELIAVPADEPGVKVELPETVMTPVVEGAAPE